jgi:radical SAM protein with 4Fe4S-binding SPASM domain
MEMSKMSNSKPLLLWSTLKELPDECKKCKYEICVSICPTLKKMVKEHQIRVIY